MKLEITSGTNVKGNLGLEGKDASIDAGSMSKLWGLLQDPYKNPIGAIVREYTSNAFDAHAEAEFIKNNILSKIRLEYPIYLTVPDEEIYTLQKNLQVFNDDAVHVSMHMDDTGHYWAVEDFGVGLSPQRVEDVFCSYLKSTKENTNNVIGAFGIGSKSGLSYADVFYIRARYNGVETLYMLRKGEVTPRLEIIMSGSTTERNGTEIKLYIKESDVYRFRTECQKQLSYFDNVYFSNCAVNNNYSLVKGEHWLKTSNVTPFEGLHICLGKVAYPIDWDNLRLPRINVDVALRFEIGDLEVIQTREDIRYTDATNEIIKKKIEAFKEEILRDYLSRKSFECHNLTDYYRSKGSIARVDYGNDTYNFDIELDSLNLLYPNVTFVPFEKVGIGHIDQAYLFNDYYVNKKITRSGLRASGAYYDVHRLLSVFNNHYCTYRIKNDHVPKKSRFIRYEEGKDVFLIRKRKYPSLKEYCTILKLKWEDKENWRLKIKTFQDEVQKHVISRTTSYERTKVSQEWLDAQKRNLQNRTKGKIVLQKGTISGWNRVELEKSSPEAMTNSLFVIGVKDQRSKLHEIGRFFDRNYSGNCNGRIEQKLYYRNFMNSRLFVATVAKTNLTYFENVKNLITVENFKTSKPFIKAITAHHLANTDKYRHILDIVNNFNPSIWNNVYTPVANAMKKVNEFIIGAGGIGYDGELSSFMQSGYQFVKENNLFDKQIMDEVNFIQKYLDNIPLIEYINWEEATPEVSTSIIKGIYMHNALMPLKEKKKVNAYYYVAYNAEELEWMDQKDSSLLEFINLKNTELCQLKH